MHINPVKEIIHIDNSSRRSTRAISFKKDKKGRLLGGGSLEKAGTDDQSGQDKFRESPSEGRVLGHDPATFIKTSERSNSFTGSTKLLRAT